MPADIILELGRYRKWSLFRWHGKPHAQPTCTARWPLPSARTSSPTGPGACPVVEAGTFRDAAPSMNDGTVRVFSNHDCNDAVAPYFSFMPPASTMESRVSPKERNAPEVFTKEGQRFWACSLPVEETSYGRLMFVVSETLDMFKSD